MTEQPLLNEIKALIKSSGPMPVWRYMEACLMHPRYGYYVSRDPLGREGDFTRWQDDIGRQIAAFPGFIKQTVMPPNPPSQVDWVILQAFTSSDAAVAWLHSDKRTGLVQQIQPLLAGADDIHIVADQDAGVRPAPISAVISTRIKPGQEGAYRQWEQKIAAAQSKAPGFQGYRFEPPIPGVQEDWLAILLSY